MKTFDVKPTSCPKCGATHDAASPVLHNRPPKTGDITICWKCGEVLQFTELSNLDAANASTIVDLATESPRSFLALAAARKAVLKNKEHNERRN